MLKKIRQCWDKFITPLPKGTTTFHGDMDKYREAVNYSNEISDKMMILSKLNRTGLLEVIKDLHKENDDYKKDNKKLKNELDTARQAMVKMEKDNNFVRRLKDSRIECLEREVGLLKLVKNDNHKYTSEMKGIRL